MGVIRGLIVVGVRGGTVGQEKLYRLLEKYKTISNILEKGSITSVLPATIALVAGMAVYNFFLSILEGWSSLTYLPN